MHMQAHTQAHTHACTHTHTHTHTHTFQGVHNKELTRIGRGREESRQPYVPEQGHNGTQKKLANMCIIATNL